MTDRQNKLRELPASNPAELAGYADNAAQAESDAEQSYVDLGFADELPQTDEGDEFGSFGVGDHIELDAA